MPTSARPDWFGRIFAPCFSAACSLACAGVVVYFSGQRAAIDALADKVSADSTNIALLHQFVESNKARRDEQVNELHAQIEALEHHR